MARSLPTKKRSHLMADDEFNGSLTERMLSKAVPLDEVMLELYKNKGRYAQQSKMLRDRNMGHMGDQYYYRDDRLAPQLNALNMMIAADQAPDREGWLGALSPYRGSGKKVALDYNMYMGDANGGVLPKHRDVANVWNDATAQRTLPHELEHTMQMARPYGADKVTSNFFGQRVPVGALGDHLNKQMFENAMKLSDEQRERIFPAANAFDDPSEFKASLAAHVVLLASMGVDFLDTKEGKILFPDKESQAYFIKVIHPGIKSMWAYREDKNAPPGVPKQYKGRKSYAQQGLQAIKDWWNDAPEQQSMLELDRAKAKPKQPVRSRKAK
jgi:hypothetical protein